MESDGIEKQPTAEWIIGYKIGAWEKQCAKAVSLGAQLNVIQPEIHNKMAYGIGPDGIPFVLIHKDMI